jgi:putative membrane protein
MKSSFASVFPSLKAPIIRRKHLRKYSWLPDVFRIKGSIINRIFGPVLTVTLFAVLVCYGSSRGYEVTLTNSIVPLLSVVVGLILVFRNGTSYDRYWEGRKSFAAMISNIRSLTRQIWVNAALPPTGDAPIFVKGKTPIATLSAAHLRKRKVDTLRLCLSFAFAVKHYLRGEDGTQWEDYADVLPASFARFDEVGYNTQKTSNTGSYDATRRSSLSASQDGSLSGRASPDATKRIRVKRSKPKLSAGQDTPLLPNTITHRNIEFHPFADQASLPLPLMIAHELSRALFKFRREGCFETVGPAGANAMNYPRDGGSTHGHGTSSKYPLASIVQHTFEAMCHSLPVRASIYPC